MKAQIKIEKPFRVDSANELYEVMGKLNSYVTEYGIDTKGNIYFQMLNGITKRYSRKEFIKMSREERNVF
jgi:hypothetical protein